MTAASIARSPFASFWQAGFEGADHINGSGASLSLCTSSGHLDRVHEDYASLDTFGIRTVRESAGWRSCFRDDGFDFADVERRAAAATELGLQVLWTCCHYGIPHEVQDFGATFVSAFARYCEALARVLKRHAANSDHAAVYTPMNEISFLAWAICETGLIHPFHQKRSGEEAHRLKMRLVEAAIAGSDAIKNVHPDAVLMHVDPLVHMVADSIENGAVAERLNALQFDAWDMLYGRSEPQLGGHVRYVDVIGVNYYHANQWVVETRDRLHWHLKDDRRRPLSALLADVSRRYQRPLTIAETSHVGSGRGRWIEDVASEIALAHRAGLRIEGLCLYPVISRPDWERPDVWHESGVWDVDTLDPSLPRHLNLAYAYSLRAAQYQLDELFTSSRTPRTPPMPTLIVFSHLRWDFVFQRPQHLLSRLASRWNILFVEEPMHAAANTAELLTPAPGVRVLRPHTTSDARGFHDEQMILIGELLARQLQIDAIDDYAVWFYTPMALPLLHALDPKAVIYDCMDELGSFALAPPQLVSREGNLLRAANVVFTGGPSLYESKRYRHPRVHCFPSSVDVAHFGRARDAAIAHPAMARMPQPRLGFFGVIDERFDGPLVAEIARRHPDWQICLVGPVVKIDPAMLPVADNIHYFGQQPYEALPAFVAGWDVCLLPFARNEATRFISPTKTLEYLAAGKPVVSTDIVDVRSLYGTAVHIAIDADDFIAGCERALQGTTHAHAVSAEALLAATSWDSTAAQMADIIAAACAEGINAEARDYARSGHVVPLSAAHRKPAQPALVDCLILGAGPTGLSAAYHYGAGSLLVERNEQVGGHCRSIEDRGFQFDYAGHIMFSNDPYVLSLYEVLLGDNLHWQNREAWIYSKNVYTRYPFQGALYGLPPEVLKECIVGAIEARYGALDGKARAPREPARAETVSRDCCADGVVDDVPAKEHSDAPAPSAANGSAKVAANFEEFIHTVWGAGVAKHFAIPYNRKLWTVPLAEMETSWLGGRVPLPNLEEMIDGALQPLAKPVGPNARFGYPLHGGFQALMDGFLPHLEGDLLLDADVVEVRPSSRTVVLRDGRRIGYRHLVSTLPLPKLVQSMTEVPADVALAASRLRHVSVRCVNIGVGREHVTDKHWIYYPEETVFHRIFVQGNASPHANAPGGFGLTCEITYSPTKPLPVSGEALIRRCIDECIGVGLIKADDPIWVSNEVDMPYAYVVYDHERAHNVAVVRDWLRAQDIFLAGRYSEWEYYNSDHAFIAGKRVAEAVREAQKAREVRIA